MFFMLILQQTSIDAGKMHLTILPSLHHHQKCHFTNSQKIGTTALEAQHSIRDSELDRHAPED